MVPLLAGAQHSVRAGEETFTVGENEFNDLTNQEFVRKLSYS